MNIHKRLEELEERKALRELRELERQFKHRSEAEELFFVVHGYFPENAGGGLPERQEFVVGDIRTVITTEKIVRKP